MGNVLEVTRDGTSQAQEANEGMHKCWVCLRTAVSSMRPEQGI